MNYKVAVIDIGSNSIKLLVADKSGALHEDVELVRISTGMANAREPRIQDDRFEAAVDTVSDLLSEAENYKPQKIKIVATSAVRDAVNKDDFCDAIKKATGHQVEVLSGVEEAQYIGNGIEADKNLAQTKDFLLFDLGGGSLEVILFKDSKVEFAESLQLGGVRLTEKFIYNPKAAIDDEALESIYNKIKDALKGLKLNWNKEYTLVGLGGVFRCTRKALGLESIAINKDSIKKLRDKLSKMTLDERLEVKGIPKGRADIMPAALTVILALMDYFEKTEVMHSTCNLRFGVALS